MASPNTIKIMEEARALRLNSIKYFPSETTGPNRAQRRKDARGWRLRSKMTAARWAMVRAWKYPKGAKPVTKPSVITSLAKRVVDARRFFTGRKV